MAVIVDVIDAWLFFRGAFPDYNIALDEVIELYLYPDFFTEHLMSDTLMALLFSVIGIVFVWRLITRTDKHDIADIQADVDAAIPINPEN